MASSGFPVFFFDGDEEIGIGDVVIDASTVFKRLQLQVSQKIGISPHQISLFLVRRKKGRFSPEIRRKTPIDERSDFSAMSIERDSFILAVLKRSRRERRERPHRGGSADVLIEKKTDEMPQKMLLRRPSGLYGRTTVGASAEERLGLGLGLGFWDVDSYKNLQRQRERYLLSTNAASYYPYRPYVEAVEDTAPLSGAVSHGVGVKANEAVCPVCLASKEVPVPFHCCVCDAITVGFRSNVGPIQRPSKGCVEASG